MLKNSFVRTASADLLPPERPALSIQIEPKIAQIWRPRVFYINRKCDFGPVIEQLRQFH